MTRSVLLVVLHGCVCSCRAPALPQAGIEVGRAAGDEAVSPALHTLRARALQAPERRDETIAAWRSDPSVARGWALSRAYFPELAAEPAPLAKVSSNVMRVWLPRQEDGPAEIETRGFGFTVRLLSGRDDVAALLDGPTASYGPRHLWSVAGLCHVCDADPLVAHRIEEYFLPERRQDDLWLRYQIELPDAIVAVRDNGDYLSFLDRRDRPVLRMHYPVARDAAGISRRGATRVVGIAPGPAWQGRPVRHALVERTLTVAMHVRLDGLAWPVVVDPAWSTTDVMANARRLHSSTLLGNGRVLVAGGSPINDTAEIYDPDTDTWSGTNNNMSTARSLQLAAILPSGGALLTGGQQTNGFASTGTEIYDPVSGTFSDTGDMGTGRAGMGAVLLRSGAVLVAGGATGDLATGYDTTDTVELYSGGAWSPTTSMSTVRDEAAISLLASGRVLVAGGTTNYMSSGNLDTSEVFDPSTETWATPVTMGLVRRVPCASALDDGRVLVTGGLRLGFIAFLNVYHASAEIYDPVGSSWTGAGSMSTARMVPGCSYLASGRVLVAGGKANFNTTSALASADVYDAGWLPAPSMPTTRAYGTYTLLPTGKVLATGGHDSGGTTLVATHLYDPQTGLSALTDDLGSARGSHAATRLPSGRVLVSGGSDGSNPMTDSEVYDPATALWSPTTGALGTARQDHSATLLMTGLVLAAGGSGGAGALDSAEIFDPSTGNWTATTGNLSAARTGHTATLLRTGNVLLAGGDAVGDSAELFVAGTATFSDTGDLSTARSRQTARSSRMATCSSPAALTAARSPSPSSTIPALGHGPTRIHSPPPATITRRRSCRPATC